jgi:hypothetical protein
MYVKLIILQTTIGDLDLDPQMCGKRSPLWGALQAYRKTGLFGGVHRGMYATGNHVHLIPNF